MSVSDLQAPASNVRFGSILLKNSFPTGDEKILAVIGSDARFRLGGYMRESMLR